MIEIFESCDRMERVVLESSTTEGQGRSGSYALRLLAVPLNVTILSQLFDGPLRLAELSRARGSAPQSTVRAHLKGMEGDGLMSKRSRKRSPGVVDFELTLAGSELLVVLGALEQWLLLAPDGPLGLASAAGRSAIKALEGGWSSAIVGTLAGGAESLSMLAKGIDDVSYPSLDRRLTAMRKAGQVEASPGNGQGTPYGVTTWLQQGVASLAAAVRWEGMHFPDETTSIARLDTEAAFLLAFPLLRMTLGLSGSCRMEVDVADATGRLCGAVALVERGRVVSSTRGADGPADSWVNGAAADWADAAVDGLGTNGLSIGGDRPLGGGVLESLRNVVLGTGT